MADPLDRLRLDSTPIAPPSDFAADLRRRYLDALDGAVAEPADTTPDTPVPDGPSTDHHQETTVMETATLAVARRRRPAVFVIVGVAAAIVVVLGLLIAGRDDAEKVDVVDEPAVETTTTLEASTSTTPASSSTVTAASAAPVSSLPAASELTAAGATSVTVERNPTFVGALFGSLWTSHQGGPVTKRDSAGGALQATVPTLVNGPFVYPPVGGFGSVWVGTYLDGFLWRIDPDTAAVMAKVAIPGGLDLGPGSTPSGPAVDTTGVWIIAGGSPRSLVHVDAATNAVDRTLPLPDPLVACCVWSGAGDLWVETTTGKLYRIDPVAGTVLAELPVAAEAGVVVFDEADLWTPGLTAAGKLEIRRVDLATNTVTARVVVSDAPQSGDGRQVAVGGGFVWTTAPDATLVKIDPATNTVVARYGTKPGVGVAVTAGAVWATVNADGIAYRLPLE